MRYIIFITFLFILSVLISCNNNAVDYNNKLVKIQKSILPQVQAFSKRMEQTSTGIITLKDIESDAKNMVTLLDKKIAEVAALSVVKGGEELKSAIIDQLKFERDIYYKTSRLGNISISEEEKSAITEEFMHSEADASKLEERVTQVQKRFAEENNLDPEKK